MSTQLSVALDALDVTYYKPDLIVGEVHRHIKNIPLIKGFSTPSQMKAAKEQITTLQIGVSTLKSLGYEEDLTDCHSLHNSFLLLEIESKIPIFAVRQWADDKRRFKKVFREI